MKEDEKYLLDNLIQEVFNQAKNGVVYIKSEDNLDWRFFIKFFTNIEDNLSNKNNKSPILFIPDYALFLEKVAQYLQTAQVFYKEDKNYFNLSQREFNKKLFLDLIINASNFDFINIYNFIDIKRKMIKKEISGEINLGSYNGLKIFCKIKKNHSNIESPYRFDIYFKNDEFEFLLPSILFGICDNTAYVMGIQNFNKTENPLSKKLDRYFRKANKGVNMDGVEGNVSPNALVSFTIFNAFMKQQNINTIKSTTIMPLRYHGNMVSLYNRATSKDETTSLLKKHNHNQFNITNKLLYMFLRYNHHFTESQTSYDPLKEEMTLYLSKQNKIKDDSIILDIENSILINKEELIR